MSEQLKTGKTFFISDTHLDPKRPIASSKFLKVLSERVSGADALYLLGDIFEYWIGDDAISDIASEVARATAALAENGTKIYFMAGNRDFLLGQAYADMAGWEILEDPTEIVIYDTSILLLHGDSLCTDDQSYQAFRGQVRDLVWQKDFLSRTIVERMNMAEQARAQSQDYTAAAESTIMDVNAKAVIQSFSECQSRIMIHGHTHRPKIHSLVINGQPHQRIVLGDWYNDGWIIEAEETGMDLVRVRLDESKQSDTSITLEN